MKELLSVIFLHFLILIISEKAYKNLIKLYVKAVKLIIEQWKIIIK